MTHLLWRLFAFGYFQMSKGKLVNINSKGVGMLGMTCWVLSNYGHSVAFVTSERFNGIVL